jgi:hypothetical protein
VVFAAPGLNELLGGGRGMLSLYQMKGVAVRVMSLEHVLLSSARSVGVGSDVAMWLTGCVW